MLKFVIHKLKFRHAYTLVTQLFVSHVGPGMQRRVYLRIVPQNQYPEEQCQAPATCGLCVPVCCRGICMYCNPLSDSCICMICNCVPTSGLAPPCCLCIRGMYPEDAKRHTMQRIRLQADCTDIQAQGQHVGGSNVGRADGGGGVSSCHVCPNPMNATAWSSLLEMRESTKQQPPFSGLPEPTATTHAVSCSRGRVASRAVHPNGSERTHLPEPWCVRPQLRLRQELTATIHNLQPFAAGVKRRFQGNNWYTTQRLVRKDWHGIDCGVFC